MAGKGLRQFLVRIFGSSKSERRGILALLPLLGVVVIFAHGVNRQKPDRKLQETADSILGLKHVPDMVIAGGSDNGLFYFDPNTATLEQFCELGFELRVAASIVKYRNAGKRFTVPEDLAMCYGVTLEKYRELEPYIAIADDNRTHGFSGRGRNDIIKEVAAERTTPAVNVPAEPFDPNIMEAEDFVRLGFSTAQAATIINYRNSIGGFSSAEQFAKCYAVSEEVFEKLRPLIIIENSLTEAQDRRPDASAAGEDNFSGTAFPVEINSADSALLRTVSGIGEVMVVRILEYRERLGGFACAEQLAEVKGMTEANYERIIRQITVDTCKIPKIDINFAPHKELAQWLERHPYVDSKAARKILSARQLKGGWSNTRELVEDKIWNEGTAVKMAPYIVFQPFTD